MALPKPTPAYSYARRTPSLVRNVPRCLSIVRAAWRIASGIGFPFFLMTSPDLRGGRREGTPPTKISSEPRARRRCCARRRFARSPARSRRRPRGAARYDRSRPAEPPARPAGGPATTTGTILSATARRAGGRAPRVAGRAATPRGIHRSDHATTHDDGGRPTSRTSWPWRTPTEAASRISAPPPWRWQRAHG